MAEEIIHQSRFRLGFELETHRFHGVTYGSEIRSDVPDTDRWEQIKQRKRETIYHDRARDYHWVRGITGREPGYDTVLGHLHQYAKDTNTDLRERVAQEINRYLQAIPIPTKTITADASYFLSLLAPNMQDRFQCERDGTVDGPEIMTKGGMTVEQTRNAARYLLSHSLQVHDGCSFHVHMSIIDVTHRPSDSLQMFMVDYLMRNIQRVPSSVLNRWLVRKERDNCRYFNLTEDCTSRYAFIAFRTAEGSRKPVTWEFRCWGNVSTFEDADTCIRLTLDAYTHAHKQHVLLGKTFSRSKSALAQDLFFKAQFELDRRQGIPLPNLSSAVGE